MTQNKTTVALAGAVLSQPDTGPLLAELRQVIAAARQSAAVAVNASLSRMYWRIGERVRREVLQGERAGYGEQTVATLSRQLSVEFGRSFSEKNMRHMVRFVEAFADEAIVSTLSRQLAWSHFLELIYLKDALARDFYAEMCRIERWSVRALRDRVGSMLGIILCTGKKREQIELLELSKSGIHVAEYLTVLPPREVFEQKIQEALALARLAGKDRA